MKHLQFLLFCVGLGAVVPLIAQQTMAPYTFEWEVVAVDSIPGMTTARLYAVLNHPEDYLTSVSGWDDMVGYIETTTSFYQDEDGWVTPNNNNPLLFDILSTLRYDSWVTIGVDSAPVGADGEIPVGVFPPETSFWVDEFEAGGNLVMDIDGAWFVTMGSSNGTAGEDLRVLVGQFTTDGVISGMLNLQVFPEGVASLEFMDDVYSVLIPEFDGGVVSGVGGQPVSPLWGMHDRVNGLHHTLPWPCRWERLDITGRIMESGRAGDGHFTTHGAGVVRVWDVSGGHVLSRWIPAQ